MIKKITRILTIGSLLSLAPLLVAQRGDTIYKTIALGLTTATSTPLPATISNIGQVYHQLSVIFHNAPAKNCVAGSYLTAYFVGSYDGVSYTPMTQRYVSGGTTQGAWKTIVALGLYPYIKVVVSSFDTANCTADVRYSGSLYPTIIPPHGLFPFDFSGDIIFVSNLGIAGDNYAGAAFTNERYTLMSLVLSNDVAGQKVIIYCGGSTFLTFNNLAAGQVVVIPRMDGMPYGICPPGNNISINLANSTAVFVNMTMHIE